MKKIVADASFCGAWLFSDEASEEAENLLEGILTGSLQLVVPALWYYEMANMLKSGLVRDRLDEAELRAAERVLGQVPVQEVDNPGCTALGRIIKLAADFNLSAYDAAYLELSDRLRVPLLSSDKKLGESYRSMRSTW